jgi:hypothetical protein
MYWEMIPRFRAHRNYFHQPYRPHLEHLEPRLAPANVDVLNYHNDPFLTGQNLMEETLTPANVNPTSFGLLFSQPVDGYVYAEPLYKANFTIAGGTHNVAFAATEHDSVYAIDAESPVAGPNGNGIYWQTSFIDPANGITTVPSPSEISNSDIVPEIGITGTPVIDGTTNTLFVVAVTKEVRGSTNHYVQKLHALDLSTGAEKVNSPYTLGDTTFGGPDGGFTDTTSIVVTGKGDGADSGSHVRFNAARENNRSALQLVNGVVYAAFAAHSDYRPYHGWLIGFDPTTLQPIRVFNTAPNAGGVGIWQSGGAVSYDPQGNVYFAVGNGFNGPNTAFDPAHGNYSESVLKLSTTGQLSVADYFTPYDWQNLDQHDADLGSGGAMLLPDGLGSAAHPHLMVETGKSGKIYLIDRDNMGKFTAGGPDNVVQIVTAGQQGVWGNPALYQIDPTDAILYYHGSGDVLKGYYVSNGHIEDGTAQGDRPIMQSPKGSTFSAFPGTQPVISANAIADPSHPVNGLVWELQVDNFGGGTPNGNKPLMGPAYLRAYDATDLTKVLYDSKLIGDRDLFGEPIKFTVPTVTDGHVLVGQARLFSVFGLFRNATAIPAPLSNLNIAVAPGPKGPEMQLNWTDPVPVQGAEPTGIKIYRSTDGVHFALLTTVFRASTTFADTGPLQIGQRYYYRVVATNQLGDSAPSNTVSAVAPIPSAVLTLTGTGTSSIGLSWTAVANNHYDIERSTDGVNFAPIATVPAFQTTYTDTGLAPGLYAYRIHAFNVNPTADSLSNVQGEWVGPALDHGNGFGNATDLTVNGDSFVSPTEQLVRLTAGDTETGSAFANNRITIGQFATSFQVRLHEGTQPYYADGFTFVIQANDPTALGKGTAGLGYQGIGHSVAVKFSTFQHPGDPSDSSTGLVLNGANPAGGVSTLSSGVLLNSQDPKQIDLTYNGAILRERIEDLLTGDVFTASFAVNIAAVIGSDTAYVGFTGASGSNDFYQLEDVLNWTFTSRVPLPGAPTNLRETAFASSAIDLSWNSNSYNESGFQVERSTDGTNFALIGTTTARSFEDGGLFAGTYYYRVRAFDSQGNLSPYSNTFQTSLPGAILTDHQDIGTAGDPAIPGSATFANGVYTLKASGSDIWNQADHFQYLYRPFLGDGEIIARVVTVGHADYWTKAGVMFREALAAGAKNAFMFETPPPDHSTPIFHWRNETDNASVEIYGPGGWPPAIWVRLTRLGNFFTGYYARDNGDGTHGPWIQLGPTDYIAMNPNIYVGLALTAHTNSTTSTSTFDHVQILPFEEYQTSHLDVSGGGGTVDPGTPVDITVQALDLYNNPVSTYHRVVHFASSDPSAVLPADYTFTLGDNGRHTFTVILETPGYQTITVTDVDLPVISGSTAITVTGASPASSFPITALDDPGNSLPDSLGTVHVDGSVPLVQLPAADTGMATSTGLDSQVVTAGPSAPQAADIQTSMASTGLTLAASPEQGSVQQGFAAQTGRTAGAEVRGVTLAWTPRRYAESLDLVLADLDSGLPLRLLEEDLVPTGLM